MTIMHDSPTDPTAWPTAVEADHDVTQQQNHAMTVQCELLRLLPIAPSSFGINRFGRGFHGVYGVEIVMPLSARSLTAVQEAIGGTLLVEANTRDGGTPYTRHQLTGTLAGVPFEVWTNVYPTRSVVTA